MGFMESTPSPSPETFYPAETASHRRVRARGEEIRGFILTNIEKNSSNIAHLVGENFGISRQAANKHLRNLVIEGALVPEGKTRYRKYKLAALFEWRKRYVLGPEIEEDLVWSRDVSHELGKLPKNVMDIWHFCITEMFNNAIDHSGAKTVFVKIAKTAANTQIMLMDDGVGIFKKVQAAMNLLD